MASGSAHARAALAGNPSDGFAGAVLACCIGELRAWARTEHATEARSDPPSALVDAAIARYGRGPCVVRWGTDVPREVGLGGSSAIVGTLPPAGSEPLAQALRALGCKVITPVFTER